MRHPLITISDLQSLTDAELNRLEATLRNILNYALGLADRDIAIILASLQNIRINLERRHTLGPQSDWII